MNAQTAAEGSNRAEDTDFCFFEETAPIAGLVNFQASMW
jgi:hypothetical protein